ncbi:MAG: DNA phosphorothioation system sulfurtransferase DndC, partial [Cyanobacteria bacterium J06629_18]
ELMANLLDTERQYRKKTRRVGIYDALAKCFETSSRNPEEAIKNAHFKRDLKNAAGEGDVDKVKQLTLGDVDTEKVGEKSKSWAARKFKKQ